MSFAQPLGLLLLGLAVRLPLMTTAGYEDDVRQYAAWAWKAETQGIHTLYLDTHGVVSDNHPGVLYPLKLAGKSYALLTGDRDFPRPDRPAPLLRFLLRVPAVLADLMMGLLFFALGLRRSPKAGLAAMGFFLFNPAIVFNSAVYGQTDALHSLFALAAFALVERGAPAAGWAAMGVAFMTKPQATILGPALAVLTWKRFGPRRTAAGLLAGTAAMLAAALPFLAFGTFGGLLGYFFAMFRVHPVVSLYGDNLWWLLLGPRAATLPDLSAVPALAALGVPVSYRALGLLLMLPVQALIWRSLWLDPEPRRAYFKAGASVLAFFALSTQMHDNYLYLAVPCLAAAAAADPRSTKIYAAVSAAAAANMLWHYPAFILWSGAPEGILAALRAATAAGVLGLTYASVTTGRAFSSESSPSSAAKRR